VVQCRVECLLGCVREASAPRCTMLLAVLPFGIKQRYDDILLAISPPSSPSQLEYSCSVYAILYDPKEFLTSISGAEK
jgi:hypothetical protein